MRDHRICAATGDNQSIANLAVLVVGTKDLLTTGEAGWKPVGGRITQAPIRMNEDWPHLGVGTTPAGWAIGDHRDPLTHSRVLETTAKRSALLAWCGHPRSEQISVVVVASHANPVERGLYDRGDSEAKGDVDHLRPRRWGVDGRWAVITPVSRSARYILEIPFG